MLASIDLDGRFRYASPSTLTVLGYAPEEIVGRLAAEFIHPDDWPRIYLERQRLHAEDGPGRLVTYRALHRAGHHVWIEAHGRVLRDSLTRQPLEQVVIARDITARVEKETELEKQRTLLETVFEHSPSGKTLLRAIRHAATGQVLDFAYVRRNRAARRQVGAPDDEELTGKTALSEQADIAQNGLFARFVEVLTTGEAWEGEVHHQIDGAETWYYATIARLDSEQISVAFINLTAIKLAERRAAEAQTKLALAAEVAGVGLSVRDLQTGEVEVTEQFRHLYGLPPTGPVSFAHLRGLMNPQDMAQQIEAYDRAIANGQDQRTRIRFRRADTGEERTMLGVSRVLKDASGKPTQVLATVLDISEAIRAERQVEEARARLALASEVAGIGLSVREVDSDVLTITPTLAAICGFPSEQTTISLAEMYAISHASDVAAMRRDYEAVMARGGTCQMRYRIRRPNDGAERTLLSRVQVLTDDSGRPVRTWVATLDITDVLQLEQRAAEAQAQLALAAEVVGLGLTERTLDTDVLQISSEYARIMGLPAGTTSLTLSKMTELFDPVEVAQRFRPYQEAVMRGETRRPIRLRGWRQDNGRPFTVLAAAGLLPATADLPARIQSVALDITDTVDAEERAASAQAQLALATEISGMGLSSCDLQTGMIEMSPTFSRLYGFEGDRTHAHISELLALSHPEDVRELRPAFEMATATSEATQQVQYRVRRADTDEWRTLLATARTVPNAGGRGGRVVSATVDITELQRAREVADQLQFWRRLTDSLPEIMWVADLEGRTTQINRRWYEYTGQTEPDVKAHIWQRAIHPADLNGPDNQGWQSAFPRNEPYELKFRLRRHDGAWRWHTARAVPVRDESGTVLHWVGLTMDIHEREMAQQALKRANTDLDTFVYAAAHDLKSPIDNLEAILTAIYEDFTERRCRQPWSEDSSTDTLFEHAGRAVDRFRATLADLAQVVAALPVEVNQPASLDLATYIADLVLDMDTEFAAAQGMLCLDLRVPVLGSLSARHLRTLLYNLINNSLKYRHPDRPARLWLRTRAAGPSWVELAISDNGIGLDPKRATRAFELFGRLHPGAAGGTGVGLFLVRRVVEQAGGQLRVSGRVGAGTSFFIRLPRN